MDTHFHPFLVDIVDMSICLCLVDMSLRLDTYVRPFHMSVPPFLVDKSICPFLVDAIVRLVNMSMPPFLDDTIQCERRPQHSSPLLLIPRRIIRRPAGCCIGDE